MAAGEQKEIERGQKSKNESFVTVISGFTGKIKLFVNGGNMKTYSTYQEAKIENPADEIFHGKLGFCNAHLSGWKLCNPADYCMTVEKFLCDGNKFVEGDYILNHHGKIRYVGTRGPSFISYYGVRAANTKDDDDKNRFILRAAALENKESDYDRGMREAMKAIAKSCGRTFAVDVGYADLPALVESMVNPVKQRKVIVYYKRVEFTSVGECVQAVHDNYGEYFFFNVSTGEYQLAEYQDSAWYWKDGNIHICEKVAIDERQEFIDASFGFFSDGAMVLDAVCKMFDSGKFKYIGGDDADK